MSTFLDEEIRSAVEARQLALKLEPRDEVSTRIEVEKISQLLGMVDEMGRFALLSQFERGLIGMEQLEQRCLTNDPRGKFCR